MYAWQAVVPVPVRWGGWYRWARDWGAPGLCAVLKFLERGMRLLSALSVARRAYVQLCGRGIESPEESTHPCLFSAYARQCWRVLRFSPRRFGGIEPATVAQE